MGSAYDPQNGYEYISGVGYVNGAGRCMVAVISGLTDIANISTKNCAYAGGAYDSVNHYVYMFGGQTSVAVLSGTSDVANISLIENGPWNSVALDTNNGYLYVGKDGGDNITVINGTSVIATISITTAPALLTVLYDSANGDVYVADGSDNSNVITIISGTSIIGTLTLTGVVNLTASVYDPVNGDLYFGAAGDEEVVVRNNQQIGVINKILGSPSGWAINNLTGEIYIFDQNDAILQVISGTNTEYSVPYSYGQFWGGVYDPANNLIYASIWPLPTWTLPGAEVLYPP